MGNLLGLPYQDAFDMVPTHGNIPNYLNFNQNKVDSLFSSSIVSASSYPQKIATYSAYVNDVFNLTEELLINAGLRIDRFENKGVYNANTGLTTGKYGQTALSPKFGVVYQIVKNHISLFGNYQNGFTNETGTDFEGKTFKPEQANQWEGGVKLNAANGKISGTLSYYNIEVKNIVRADPAHPNFSIQDANQKSRGLETELALAPINGLSIIVGYSYNDSKYLNADDDINNLRPVTAGPKNTANFWGSYTITSGKLKYLGFGFGGNYAGKTYAINSRTDGQLFLPSYTLLNGTIYYEHPKFILSAKMNNIGNKHYWIGYTTMDAQMLRQFIGSIAFKF